MPDDPAQPLAKVAFLWPMVSVKNLEESYAWYRDQLGFREVRRRSFPEYGTTILFMEANGVRIELIEDAKWQPVNRLNPPQHSHQQGVCQIAFKVDDIQAVLERVKSRSITIAWDLLVLDDMGFKEFFIRDNEGNIIQFAESFTPSDGGPRL
jgi:catechol 2,3-dioxygenase-like lactoylglutathione lyase family enzyme